MATKRMINKTLIDSDAFLDMPQSSQNLYFHLIMRADDDGFLDNPKKVMRTIGANQNDFELLMAKRYLLGFDSGVIVIKHWKLHNTIRKDRYKPTLYIEELSKIAEKKTELIPMILILYSLWTYQKWQPMVYQMVTIWSQMVCIE